MQDGKLTQYDFPGAVQTFIYGLSDETGALSGNIVDETGVTRAFSGDLTITFPGAVATYGDFVLVVTDTQGNIVSEKFNFTVNAANLANAVLSVRLTNIGTPKQNLLLQNYPNPFNPETWIPYRLSEASPVSLSIYDTTGELIRTFSLGDQSAGFYQNRERAVYWDGRNTLGEPVASGIYFYQLTTPTFQQTRRLIIVK